MPLAMHSNHWNSVIPSVKMAFGGSGAGTDSSSEELNFNAGGGGGPPSKKRYRTKFTQDQKEKMMEFAEKVGWRIPREDDAEVQRFCAEIGVKRQVFKVWMHNNKSNSSSASASAAAVGLLSSYSAVVDHEAAVKIKHVEGTYGD